MYNLKIKEKRGKSWSAKQEICLENLSLDDEWLATGEDDEDLLDENDEGINLQLWSLHL